MSLEIKLRPTGQQRPSICREYELVYPDGRRETWWDSEVRDAGAALVAQEPAARERLARWRRITLTPEQWARVAFVLKTAAEKERRALGERLEQWAPIRGAAPLDLGEAEAVVVRAAMAQCEIAGYPF